MVRDFPLPALAVNPYKTLNPFSHSLNPQNMAITFQLSALVHEDPQFGRLRRSSSPHPRALPAKPKSGMSKAVEAVKDYLKTPRGTIKHWLRYGPRHSDMFPKRYPIHHRRPLETSWVTDHEECYELGLFPDTKFEEADDELKASSAFEDDDMLYDSGVDLPEATSVKNYLVMKDGRVYAWWKIA